MAKKDKKSETALAKRDEQARVDETAEGGLAEPKPVATTVDVLAALDADKMLQSVEEMDDLDEKDYKQGDADFWKPAKEGDSIAGVYIGTDTSGRIKQHLLAVRSKTDPSKVMIVRFNGSMKTTSDIRNNGEQYRPLRIVWNGKKPTGNGREVNLYELYWGPRPSAKVA